MNGTNSQKETGIHSSDAITKPISFRYSNGNRHAVNITGNIGHSIDTNIEGCESKMNGESGVNLRQRV